MMLCLYGFLWRFVLIFSVSFAPTFAHALSLKNAVDLFPNGCPKFAERYGYTKVVATVKEMINAGAALQIYALTIKPVTAAKISGGPAVLVVDGNGGDFLKKEVLIAEMNLECVTISAATPEQTLLMRVVELVEKNTGIVAKDTALGHVFYYRTESSAVMIPPKGK